MNKDESRDAAANGSAKHSRQLKEVKSDDLRRKTR